MLLLSLLAGCCLSPVLALPVVEDGAPTSAPAVVVKNGTYSGVHAPGYGQDFFLGMPYAQKAERWMQAQSLNDTWQDSREATAYPKHCVGYGGDMTGYEVSEDCLYLNVVRPAGLSDTADLPVAVWIHGGGLFMGGSADKRYNLSFIVEESVKQGTPMIGVSLNYRLSAFGFPQGKQAMDAGIANIGFLDQRLALRWINENIAAFGGSPNKVTIWGESSGAESVSAQVFAYNGRDDGLFRGAIAQSGFGGVIPTRFPGGFNNTAAPQAVFDALVTNTTCAPTVGTDKVITCLRGLPFEEINAVLNGTAPPGPWAPQFDGDFFADYPANQIDQAKFPKIPVLIGHNTDEGTSFGKPGINTDADLAAAIRQSMLSEGAVTATGKSAQALVDELMYLYPDIQSRGIPSLASWPDVITPGSAEVARLGLQYRRSNALFGDLSMAYCRRRASRAWAAAGLSSWSYRFDAGVVGVPPSVSSAHFFEVAYVFANLAGVGYAPNARPFPADAPGVAAYTDLSKAMSTAWVNFVTGLDPNGAAAPSTAALPAWPAYNLTAGGGVGQNIVFAAKGDGSYVEVDDYRAEGINWLIENSLTVLGN